MILYDGNGVILYIKSLHTRNHFKQLVRFKMTHKNSRNIAGGDPLYGDSQVAGRTSVLRFSSDGLAGGALSRTQRWTMVNRGF